MTVNLAETALDANANPPTVVFLSQDADKNPAANAACVRPARYVALPSIAYRLARVAAGDGVAAVSLNGPGGWDYAAGHALAAAAKEALEGAGGRVVGQVAHPLGTTDYSAYLLQAQASRAKFVFFTAGGSDLINALKQAREFGLAQRGQQIGTAYTVITDVHAIGLEALQGLNFVTAFYWDRDEQTRAFARRFFPIRQKQPTMFQAGVHSAVSQYLKAVKATGSSNAEDVRGWLRDHPFEDAFARNARLLPNGRLIHDMLTARIKSPSEQRHPWDYYEILGAVPAAEAFRPIERSKCRSMF